MIGAQEPPQELGARRRRSSPWTAERTPARATTLAVLALTLLAFGLRLVTMRDSLQGDELFMFNIVHDRTLGQAMSIVRETEKTPPLLFILNWFTSRIGDPTYWVRLPSLLFGTALVPLTYALGKRTFGRTAGIVGSAMVALSAFGIFYGVECRAYAAVAMFSAASTFCLLEALRTNRRLWWGAYVLAALAAIYSHYIAFFVVLVQAAWALWAHRERLRALLIVHGLVLLGFLPWLPSFLVQESHSADEARRIAGVAPFSFSRLVNLNVQELFGQPFVPLHELPGSAPVGLAIAVVGFGMVVALIRNRAQRPWSKLSSPCGLVIVLALVAPLGVAVVSLRPGMSFMLARNLSCSFVMAMLVLGWLVSSLRRSWAIPAAGALVAVAAIGAFDALRPQNRRTPYREVADWIDANSRPGDPIIQIFFVPTELALKTVTEINLSHPHPIYTRGSYYPVAYRRGRMTGRLFLTADLPGPLKSIRTQPRRLGPGGEFRLVRMRHFAGLDDVLAAEYRYMGR